MLQSYAPSGPSRWAQLIHRLQWVSVALAWNIFIITFTATLGFSALWISMSAALLTIAFEMHLIRRRAQKMKEGEAGELGLAETQNAVDLNAGRQAHDSAGPAPYNAQAQVPTDTPNTTAPPSPIPTTLPQVEEPKIPAEYCWMTIVARLALVVLWLAAVITGIVIAAILGRSWSHRASMFARAIEIILMFGMLALQSLLSVLSIQERERTISGRGPSVVWFERGINL